MKRQRQNVKGFTLIELLIVLVMIGVLATIAIPKYSSVRERSYMTMVVQDLKNFASQQEIYHGDNWGYAPSVAALTSVVVSEGVNISANQADGRGWAATGWHDAVPNRQCGIYYGTANPSNGSPGTSAGVIACDP